MKQYPAITADLSAIRQNAETLVSLCRVHGVSVAAVTKAVCADERIARALSESGADWLADSRTDNLARIIAPQKKLLLRVPMPSEAEEAVRASDAALFSEAKTLRAFDRAAQRAGKRYGVILMVDLGDLREGLLYSDRAGILKTARLSVSLPHLSLLGVGTNLTCYGAILPDETNLSLLCEIAEWLRSETGLSLPIVSGGNSSTLGLLRDGRVPAGITQLRLGESILLGNDTAACAVFDGLRADAFTLTCELIEVQTKPSLPVGVSGANAFGEKPVFADRGVRARGILAFGRQDMGAGGLTPLDPLITILGASSDHLIVDLTDAKKGYRVGDILCFRPDYGALLGAYTSPYVKKLYR